MAPRSKSATLNIVIAGDAKGAQKAMKQTETGAKGLSRSVGGLAASVGGLLAGGALVRWGKEAIDTYRNVGAELLTLQRLSGGSDEFIPGLFVAAQQSGVAIDKLTQGIGILSSKIQNGGVEKLGIDIRNADGSARSFEDILGDIQDRYAELEGTERTAFARGLFGRGGTDMMKLLAKSREEMAGFVEEAQRLGITLNAEDLKQATQNQRDFQLALTAAKVTMGKELLPVVTQFTTVLANNMPAIAQAVGSVASAFNALPAPVQAVVGLSLALGPALRLAAVAFGPVLTGLKSLAGAKALDSFRLGLMGVTNAGAGAGNAVGGFIRQVATSPVALGGAALGIGVVVSALIQMQQEAAAAKQTVNELVSAAESGGKSIEEVFRDRLAKTLVGAEGGFAKSYGENIQQGLDRLGISADEFFAILQAGGSDVERLQGQLEDLAAGQLGKNDRLAADYEAARVGVGNLADAWVGANRQQRELKAAQEALGVETEETTEATDRNTTSTQRNTSATRIAADAVDRRKAALDKVTSATDARTTAEENAWNAAVDLADAEQAASGNSEAMADARQAEVDALEGVQDALKGVADAEEAVGEAQDRVRDAQRDLNDAREEAAQKIAELAEASRDAQLAIRGADIDVREAYEKWQDILRSPASQIEKDQAEQDYLEAVEAAQDARDEAATAQQEAAEAAAAGVEGSPEVLAAKEALADANEGVTDALERVQEANQGVEDANRRVADAERNTAQVAKDAAVAYEEAKKNNEKAAHDLVLAQGEVIGAVSGTKAQVDFLREALLTVYPEGSQQRKDIEALVRALEFVSNGTYMPGRGEVDPGVGLQSDAGRIPQDESRDPVRARRGGPQVNLYVNGTAAQERRHAKRLGDDLADRLARSFG